MFLAACGLLRAAPASSPQLWYWHHSYLTSPSAVQSSESLIDRAAAAGYTGVAIWDSSFSFMAAPFWPQQNVQYLQQVMNYAVSKGLKVLATVDPYGFSNDALQNNPNWAESQRIIGATFQVSADKTRLTLMNSFPGLANAGFESGRSAWFGLNDAGTDVDSSVSHSGSMSGRIQNAPANARLTQWITLKPWRQYHARLFYKTQNFHGDPQLEIMDASDFSKNRLNAYWSVSGDHNWTELDYTFNSEDSTNIALYLGCWGGTSGTMWIDDVLLEETSLIYVTRRSGTPLKLYDANSGTAYEEGTDFNPVADPQMNGRTPFTAAWHTPPTVSLPSGTHLAPGQTVAIDYYAVTPVPTGGVGMCLTEPGTLTWLSNNAAAVSNILPPGQGYFLQYDEMRQMNSCGSCRAKNMTAGQLLSWHVGQTLGIYGNLSPGAPVYVWSDMFDPYHNAVNHYYCVEGDISGSWQALPSNVTIMNWNLGNLAKSLNWFSGLNTSQLTAHHQIIAGYYDNGNGALAASWALSQASGIPNVDGLMYTTWTDDYSQLEAFASSAKTAWASYVSSLNGSSAGTVPSGEVSIIAKSSGKCLDISGASTANGGEMIQYTCSGHANQRWQFVPINNGLYEIVSQNSGLVFDVTGGPSATQDGALLEQWAYVGGSNQQWQVQSNPDGYFTIVAHNSGKCVDVTGGPSVTADGVRIHQWTCWGGDNQKWKLVP